MKSSNIKLIEVTSMAKVEAGDSVARKYLENLCTLKVRDMNGNVFPLSIYYHLNYNRMLIPRALFNKKMPITESKYWEFSSFEFTGKLRDYQKPIVKSIVNAYKDGHYGGILKAGTGTGKSVIGLKIASEIGGKVCIIVPLARIVDQWKEYILKFTDIKENEIGIVWQDKIDYRNKKIVIAMLPSLAIRLRKYPESFYSGFNLTIWDEGHVLGAKTFSQVIPLFHDRFRLMLSATPRRKDGAENVFKYHIGRVLVKYDKVLLTPKVLKLVYTNHKVRDKSFTYNRKFNRGRFLNTISSLSERNKIIVKYIITAYKKGRKIIVMSDRIQQLRVIEKLLSLEGIRVSRYYSKYKDTSEPIILATYGSLGMAVDLPDRDTLILATPKSDIEQAVGRILREYGGKKDPVVVDIVDTASEKMKAGWKSREKYYNKVGATIKVKIIRGV